MTMSDFKPKHFNWAAKNGVAVITLKGAERKNPITFESYAELGQTFRELARARDIKVVVFGSNSGNFCSGGDVHDIIGPLTSRDMKGLLEFTRMTGELEPRTRTMLIEVHLDNADGFFTPGSFAYVTLHVPVKSYIQVPVAGLITRGDDNIVGVLDNDVVRFRKVVVASTDGATISLAEGLQSGERVAINLPNEVTNGSRVQAIANVRTR